MGVQKKEDKEGRGRPGHMAAGQIIITVMIITANMHLVLTIRFSHLVLITTSGILLRLD